MCNCVSEQGDGRRLLTQKDLNEAYWLNRHVHTAYRPPHLSTQDYLKSVFEWNNETINIWTHLIGFIYFSYQQYEFNKHFLPLFNASLLDHFVVTVSVFCAQICMLFSTSYHVFGCSSIPSRQKWLRFDVFGVTAGLIGMYTLGIYAAFYCFEELRTKYFTMLFGLFVFSMYMPSRNDFLKSKLFGTRVGYLHLTYIAIAAFGLFPTAHWVSLYGGLENEYVTKYLLSIVTLYTLTASAFVFYATMIPERFKPGFFDILGSSHQWWHSLIFAAMYFWYSSSTELLSSHHNGVEKCQINANVYNQTYF
uniref:Progestin and adipoQ receptor family member 3 n=1 Tax=Syphacia muris TaxID=451379 RepID=A0A0N5AMF4_9BILA